MRKLVAFVLLMSAVAFGQNPATAVFPGAVTTDSTIFVATPNSTSRLTLAINAVELAIHVADGTKFRGGNIITIGTERMLVCSVLANVLTLCTGSRGFDNTVAAAHSAGLVVDGLFSSRHYNQVAAEIKEMQKVIVGPIVYNVKSYGAKGDGTTDDTAAIQAAIDAAHAAGGGTVVMPLGTYALTESLHIKAGVQLVGTSNSGVIIQPRDKAFASTVAWQVPTWTAANGAVYSVIVFDSTASHASLQNVTVRANSANQTVVGYSLATFDIGASYSTVSDTRLIDDSNVKGGAATIFGTTSIRNQIINNYIQGASNTCLAPNIGMSGIFAQGTGGIIRGNYLTGICDDVIVVNGSPQFAGTQALDTLVEDNYVVINQSAAMGIGFQAIHVENNSRVKVVRNVIISANPTNYYCMEVSPSQLGGGGDADTHTVSLTDNYCNGLRVGLNVSGGIAETTSFIKTEANHFVGGILGITIYGLMTDFSSVGDTISGVSGNGAEVIGADTKIPSRISFVGLTVLNSGTIGGSYDCGIMLRNTAANSPPLEFILSAIRSTDTRIGAAKTQDYAFCMNPNNSMANLTIVGSQLQGNRVSSLNIDGGLAAIAGVRFVGNLTDEAVPDVLGSIRLIDQGSKPTCDATTRGTIWRDDGGTGVADTIEVCAKNSSNTYAWYAMATIP